MNRQASPGTFDRSVYEAISRIPAGRVATYKQIAAEIGCGSARAVGQALRRNPFAPEVPCHRVVRVDGDLGGYQGEEEGGGIARKKALLRSEGVVFRGERTVDLERSGWSPVA